MSSGVGAIIDFDGGAFVARYFAASSGGGITRNRLMKPYLDQDYVSQEAESQDTWEPVSCRIDLDGLQALPPKPADGYKVLSLTYPQNFNETAPGKLEGNAQVLSVTFPEMIAGSIKEMEIVFVWNDEPTYTPPTMAP